MREQKGYARKRRLGLVPHYYGRELLGADRHWPRRGPGESHADYSRRLARMARMETPSNNGYVPFHTWPANHPPAAVRHVAVKRPGYIQHQYRAV